MIPPTEILRVLALSDLHLPKPASRLILDNRVYLDRMDFAVLLGDMVQCYGTPSEYEAVRAFVTELKLPYTPVCGNHEWYFESFAEDSGLYGQVWAQASEEEQCKARQRFQEFWKVPKLWRAQTSPLGHFVFLSLDETRAGKQECLSDPQWRFLGAQIEAAGDKPLWLWCHAPLLLRERLGLIYYDEQRTGCVEPPGAVREALENRAAPSFWMSGHVHLRPDHPVFPPYRCGGNVWQIHCPDSWGYGRWTREQRVPARYEGPFSRHLEIDGAGVSFVTHDHRNQQDVQTFRVDY